MLLALFIRLVSRLFGLIESHYLQWTRLPQSSLTLGLALELPRSRSELLLEIALLRQQLIVLQRQVQKAPLLAPRSSLPLTPRQPTS